jgi:hypothetical protein
MNEEVQRALPRDAPSFHRRQAAHYRAMAEAATTAWVKSRLMEQAEQHEEIAEVRGEPELHLADAER